MYKYTFFIFILFFYSGCSIIDPPEKIPSFISINAIELQINNSNEGTAIHAITDAWVYINGNLEGTYELPAEKIPLHYQGNQELKIYAGIKKNGISDDRDKYDFFTSYSQTIELIPDSIIPVNPIVEYEDNIYIWIEDFEDPSTKFESTLTSDTTLYIVDSPTSDLIEGDAGAISLRASNYQCEIRTDELNFNIFPTNLNVPCYMELNYKCNHEFTVGILHKYGLLPYSKEKLITLISTEDDSGIAQWNKTYLYLSDVTNFFPNAQEFDIFIETKNPNQKDDIEIRLDNIKVIYRN